MRIRVATKIVRTEVLLDQPDIQRAISALILKELPELGALPRITAYEFDQDGDGKITCRATVEREP